MGKRIKKTLIIGGILVCIGAVMFSVAMSVNRWDFTVLNTVKFESSTYVISEEFDKIMLDTDTADVTFIPTSDGKCKVTCYERENVRYSLKAQNGTLEITEIDTRKWYEHIGVAVETPRITVQLPKIEYASLNIKESTGDISIKDINAGKIELSVSTGEITVMGVDCEGEIKTHVSTGNVMLSDITCNTLISDGTTGDITLENVKANKEFSIKRDTGNVILKGCDANELLIETNTGDIRGTLLSDKVFIAETDTGDVDVPKTTSGGKCELITDTGDIKISIK